MGKPNFTATWDDLGIEHSDWQDDPKAFAIRCRQKASELAAELERPNSVASNEEMFKAKAASNSEAAAKAQEFIDQVESAMMEFEPEVLVNILLRMPNVTKSANTFIRSLAMRQSRQFSKKRTHAMYVKLRKMYDSWRDFTLLFNADIEERDLPVIPPKSGNYADKTDFGIKEYLFKIDGEEYLNYYWVGKVLGIEVTHYMDAVEFFEANPEYNGMTLEVVDISY